MYHLALICDRRQVQNHIWRYGIWQFNVGKWQEQFDMRIVGCLQADCHDMKIGKRKRTIFDDCGGGDGGGVK